MQLEHGLRRDDTGTTLAAALLGCIVWTGDARLGDAGLRAACGTAWAILSTLSLTDAL